jgi:hypothetical protein
MFGAHGEFLDERGGDAVESAHDLVAIVGRRSAGVQIEPSSSARCVGP